MAARTSTRVRALVVGLVVTAGFALLPALDVPAEAAPRHGKGLRPVARAAAAMTAGGATSTSPTSTPPAYWVPARGTSWQIQYSGPLDTSVDVSVYDIDGFDTSATTVAALRARGRHAVCYISAGSYEDWRPDAAQFPADVLGRTNGWPGERWLDIRRLDVLGPVLTARIRMCRDKGFSAVDPDNVDGYANDTGFGLTAADQLVFNRWLATVAHDHGLSIGLKNDLDQVPQLVDVFDFAVNEQCYQYAECDALLPFTRAGKAVLHVEYSTKPAKYCPVTTRLGFSSLLKKLSLSAARQAC